MGKCTHDTCRARTLNLLGSKLGKLNPDSGIILTHKALRLAEKTISDRDPSVAVSGKISLAQSKHQLGLIFMNTGRNDSARSYYRLAITDWKNLAEAADKKTANTGKAGESKSLINLGVVLASELNYQDALDCYYKALALAEETGQKQWQANALGNIGNVYHSLFDYKQSLQYAERCYKLSEEMGDRAGMARNLGNIGRDHFHLYNYDKAMDCFQKSLTMAQEANDNYTVLNSLNNIAGVYTSLKKYPEALNFYQRSYSMAKELQFAQLEGVVLGNIGSLYILTGEFSKAEPALKEALAICSAIGREHTVYQHHFLYRLYDTTGRPVQAYYHFRKYAALKDSLTSDENEKSIIKSQLTFEFEKKQLAAKAELEKKEALVVEKLRQKERERNYFIAGSGLLFLFGLFMVKANRDKHKANRIIREQKELVEAKQKEILDSINYASRIQKALLPGEKALAGIFQRLKM